MHSIFLNRKDQSPIVSAGISSYGQRRDHHLMKIAEVKTVHENSEITPPGIAEKTLHENGA